MTNETKGVLQNSHIDAEQSRFSGHDPLHLRIIKASVRHSSAASKQQRLGWRIIT